MIFLNRLINIVSKSGLVFMVMFVLYGCAASYHLIEPEKQSYYTRIITDSVDIGYNQDILKTSGNYKQERKAKKKDISLVALEINNKGKDTLNPFCDIVFMSSDSIISLLSVEEEIDYLRQHPGIYFLGIFSFAFSAGTAGTAAALYLNPLGLIYAIPNALIAHKANKRMSKEFMNHDYFSTLIAPGDTMYSLLCYKGSNSDKLVLYSFKGSEIDSSQKSAEQKLLTIDSILYFSDKYESFDSYYNIIMTSFKSDPSFIDIKLTSDTYKNGNLKLIGLKAKHKKGNNEEYFYKIGTWRFFHENGQLKEYVNYNLLEEKDGVYKEYDAEGKIIKDYSFEADRRIFYTVCETEINKNQRGDLIIKNNEERIKCKIVDTDKDYVYVEGGPDSSIKIRIKQEEITRIVYGR